MPGTRSTQPYRQSGSRGPSQVLDAMRAGRAVGAPNALMAAMKGKTSGKQKRALVPRVTPFYKRK